MSRVLVVNSGSSSLKYQLIELDGERMLASGLVDRIGEASSVARHTTSGSSAAAQPQTTERELPIADHTSAFEVMLEAFASQGPQLESDPPVAVGHRVVHGGSHFVQPTLITAEVKQTIDQLSSLAPLHNPPNLVGILAAEATFPTLPQVAVFDTAFHSTLDPVAYTYAIDAKLAAEHGIRRYGFHGISFEYVAQATARFLGRPIAELRLVILHIGNGASACAVDGGRSVETSMGLTPLEGLVMGTRGGDLDPGALIHLQRSAGLDCDALDDQLSHHSGMFGMTGHGDVRDVQAAAAAGDVAAALALDVYLHRIRHYVGAYLAQLGGADAIVFTAGVGENNQAVRAGALAGLDGLGIRLDAERNAAPSRDARVVSADDSPISVLVVPTNEELEIARQTLALVRPGA